MPYHYETGGPPEHYHHEYTEGGAAAANDKPRIAPFENQESPEAKAWFLGYDDIKKPVHHIPGEKLNSKE